MLAPCLDAGTRTIKLHSLHLCHPPHISWGCRVVVPRVPQPSIYADVQKMYAECLLSVRMLPPKLAMGILY